jgi:hypothetical protein
MLSSDLRIVDEDWLLNAMLEAAVHCSFLSDHLRIEYLSLEGIS